MGHVRRRPRRQRLRAERPRRSTTTTTPTSCGGSSGSAPRSTPTRTPAPSWPCCGDYNIAPDDRDVWSPKAFEGATHTSEPERAALARLEEWGLEDVFRRHHDVGGLFSWWDYRGGDFHQGRGMRIDLVLATASLAERSSMVLIDRNARKGKQPSDHAPVVVDFTD